MPDLNLFALILSQDLALVTFCVRIENFQKNVTSIKLNIVLVRRCSLFTAFPKAIPSW